MTTPRSKAAYLLQYITDESCIIAHIKRDFGYDMDLSELRRIKGSLPNRGTGFLRTVAEPIYGNIQAKPQQDRLLYALAEYHEKRKPHEGEHWRKVKQRALGRNYGAVA